MKLSNEIAVEAPLERVWPALLDVPRVAGALPGAEVEPDADGGYRGTMKVRIGPVTMEYAGTAALEEVDEDDHVARFRALARERRGQGTAAAAIAIRATARDQRTVVVVETELEITGRPAQFGRGMMEDIAAGMLDEFAGRLERELTAGDDPGAPPPASEGEDVLDLGAAIAGPLRERAILVAAGFAVGFVLARLTRGR